MSTVVDITAKANRRRPRSSSVETRARILIAARLAFSRTGFDHVGVRELAKAARTDAAVVIRLFGSKEALLVEVASTAFDLEPLFRPPLADLGRRVAAHLLGRGDNGNDQDGFDAFQFLLRSATSPVAGPIVSASLEARFVAPLAALIGGDHAPARAALIASYVIGATMMRFTLRSTYLDDGPHDLLVDRLCDAIQKCIGQNRRADVHAP